MVEHLPSMCEVLINKWKKRREKGGKEEKKKRRHKAQGRKRERREGEEMGWEQAFHLTITPSSIITAIKSICILIVNICGR